MALQNDGRGDKPPVDLASTIQKIEAAIRFCELHDLAAAAVDLSMGLDKLLAAKAASERG